MIKLARACLGGEELTAVQTVFSRGYFGQGSQVFEFEAALKEYLQADYVIATNTGTSALHLALDALGLHDGDEVIVPTLTFVACFQAISATGATPVPCDIDPDTLLMDLSDAERRITTRTKALMPVHYAGNPCDPDALLQIKERYGIRVVEDAAHAFGSTWKGQRIGGFGDIVCFSFDSIKNLTCGEGGAVVCRDAELAELMRQKRLLGMDRRAQSRSASGDQKWEMPVGTQGFRYHMSNINAAIGLEQIKKVDCFIKRRREICRRYDSAFAQIKRLAILPVDYRHVAPHIYVVRVKGGQRNCLMDFLKSKEIETGINYALNHLQPYFRREGVRLPAAEAAYEEILSLPLHCALSDSDVDLVIRSVQNFFEEVER